MSQTQLPPPASPADNPFRYGWRPTHVTRADGSTDIERIPLTLEDVLHPQLGDIIPTSIQHVKDCFYLYGVFEQHLDCIPNGLVLSDCLINWGIADMKNHAPDVSVFANLDHQPSSACGLFHRADYHAECVFLIELVSPNTRENDVVHKMKHYHTIKVPLYILVDWPKEDAPRTLRAYRYTPGSWVPAEKDGRVMVPKFGLYLEMREGRTVAVNARTHEVIEDFLQLFQRVKKQTTDLANADQSRAELFESYEEEVGLRQQAQRRSKAIKKKLRAERRQLIAASTKLQKAEDLAKQAADLTNATALRLIEAENLAKATEGQLIEAEDLAKAEAEERKKAEDLAKAEAVERKKAEDLAKAEAEERRKADERAKKAEERAAKTEEQMQALLAELQQLRNKPA